jgi:hypothetical protein
MRIQRVFPILFILLSTFILEGGGQGRKPFPSGLDRTSGSPNSTLVNISQISEWHDDSGLQGVSQSLFNFGLVYPRGTAHAIFESGLIWGGKFYDGRTPTIRVNGQSYNTGTMRGAILGVRTGLIEDPTAPDVRIWRIRKDYAAADLRQDAAEIHGVPIYEVTDAQIEAIRAQYAVDWEEWPWQKGAPFYDSNENGIKEPAEDPGLAGADQVIWYVCNDVGVQLQPWTNVASGLEEQATIWGYNKRGVMGDVVFRRFRLFYKGVASTPQSASIDSMYLCQWSDPDLGIFGDDFVGCDTMLNVGYVYNGLAFDNDYLEYSLSPPAVGFDMLQGPLVTTGNPSDTAIFDLKKVTGAQNLPMTAFLFFGPGLGYSDPPFSPGGGIQWYQMMRGLPPTPQGLPEPLPLVDPVTGRPTSFWVSGDPGTGEGWIDGMFQPPGDRRLMVMSGPFSMAVGDSQEIIVAVIGGVGGTNINSISVMKSASRNIQVVQEGLYSTFPPVLKTTVSFPSSNEASLLIIADGRDNHAQGVNVAIRREGGSLVTNAVLYDDGTHGDQNPNDTIFTNTVTMAREPGPVYLDADVVDYSGDPFQWERLSNNIATIGSFEFSSARIFSDNLNADGMANPGENIRYGFTVSYSGTSLSDVLLIPSLEPDRKQRSYETFADGMRDSMTYDPNLPESYFSLDIPEMFLDSLFSVPLSIRDANNNVWYDTTRFAVHPFSSPVRPAIIDHAFGNARGSFDIVVVDSGAAYDHLYAIKGVNRRDGTLGIILRDSTDGRILLDTVPIPDSLGHNVPVTDGFKVLRGSIETDWGWKGLQIQQPPLLWSPIRGNGLDLEGFVGAMGKGFGSWYSSSSTYPQLVRDVLIRFAATDTAGNLIAPNDTLASFGYRYLRNADSPAARPEFEQYIVNPDSGFAYQDFQRKVPFAAYDVSNVPPRRLAVGFLENNAVGGLLDGKYWPPSWNYTYTNTDTAGPFEWSFIFDFDYSEVADTSLQVDIERDTLPIMWWGTPTRLPIPFQANAELLILAGFPFTSQDVWTFNPTIVVGVKEEQIPLTYKLFQNYPNPFNPSTTVSYELPTASKVTLKIYNILGQEIKTLIDDVQAAGAYRLQWDARNNSGNRVATGVYFYRLEVSSISSSGHIFAETKKMLLIR